jgi:hypothetical protein
VESQISRCCVSAVQIVAVARTGIHYSIWSRIYIYKAVPLLAWSGPKGSRKLRFPDFMTTAQDGGKVVSLRHRPPLSPGNSNVLISVRG